MGHIGYLMLQLCLFVILITFQYCAELHNIKLIILQTFLFLCNQIKQFIQEAQRRIGIMFGRAK